jgi:hypothetical protein
MMLTVTHFQRLPVQKRLGERVPGMEGSVSNLQDAHLMRRQKTKNVRLFQIDV